MMAADESSRTGTRMYAPPESLAGRPFTTQGDVYALGVLLYQMAVARPGPAAGAGVGARRRRRAAARGHRRVRGRRPASGGSAARRSSRRRLRTRRSCRSDAKRERQAARGEAAVRRSALRAAAPPRGRVPAGRDRVGRRLPPRALAPRGTRRQRGQGARTAPGRQLALMDKQIQAGDSLAQSKRYAEAFNDYAEAWDLAEQLGVSPLSAVSGMLQVMEDSPQPLINRTLSGGPDGRVSPVARVRLAPLGQVRVAGRPGGVRAIVIDLPAPRKAATLPLTGWGCGIAFALGGQAAASSAVRAARCRAGTSAAGRTRRGNRHRADRVRLRAAPSRRTARRWCRSNLRARPLGRADALLVARTRCGARAPSTRPPGLLSVAFSPDGKRLATRRRARGGRRSGTPPPAR